MRNYNHTGILTQINTGWFDFIQTVTISMQKKDEKAHCSNMETEIFEQPSILAALAKKYITAEKYILINLPLNIKKVILIASGSSYNCAYIAAELLKENAKCDAECVYASEFTPECANEVGKDTLFVFISQSGETTDTLEALKYVSSITDKTLCITNNDDSTIWQLSNYKIHTMAGKEYSIASTKAVSAQLFCIYLIILKIMYSKNIDITSEVNCIQNLSTLLANMLENPKELKSIAKKLSKFEDIAILGSRAFYALGKEGSLKIKETSYINTTAYPQGEFMHGHVAILNNKKAAVISLIDKRNEALCISNLKKIKQDYKPVIVTISNSDVSDEIDTIANHCIKIDANCNMFNLFGGLVALQVIALEIAKSLKRNIDRPIGLKKVVIN